MPRAFRNEKLRPNFDQLPTFTPKKSVELNFDKNGSPSPKKSDGSQEKDLMSLSEAFDFFKNGLKNRMDLRRKMIPKSEIKDLEEQFINSLDPNNVYEQKKRSSNKKTTYSNMKSASSKKSKKVLGERSDRKNKVNKMKNISKEMIHQDTWTALEKKVLKSKRTKDYIESSEKGLFQVKEPSKQNTKKNRRDKRNSNIILSGVDMAKISKEKSKSRNQSKENKKPKYFQ
jgi:hypothetical protein